MTSEELEQIIINKLREMTNRDVMLYEVIPTNINEYRVTYRIIGRLDKQTDIVRTSRRTF